MVRPWGDPRSFWVVHVIHESSFHNTYDLPFRLFANYSIAKLYAERNWSQWHQIMPLNTIFFTITVS